jgi:DNA modification methylase
MVVIRGDCVEEMRKMPADSVDAVVCDPPYGLEFMGKEWDSLGDTRQPFKGEVSGSTGPASRMPVRFQGQLKGIEEWHFQWATEAFRVLKPGGFILAFSGTRTYHRLACAVEDAGFEIRDQIDWVYNSGFSKSMNVARSIDKSEGLLGDHGHAFNYALSAGAKTDESMAYQRKHQRLEPDRDWQPKSGQAKKWFGWGTALKPSHEPVVVGRKPLIGTVAENLAKHGTGAININATRVASGPSPSVQLRESRTTPVARVGNGQQYPDQWPDARSLETYKTPHPGEELGRWPPNLLLDSGAAEEMDRQTPDLSPQRSRIVHATYQRRDTDDYGLKPTNFSIPYDDEGGGSRFFPVFSNDVDEPSFVVVPKASRSEREAGLAGLATKAESYKTTGYKCRRCGLWKVSGNPCVCVKPDFEPVEFDHPSVVNIHPTVKPIALMRWLCRLVTQPGGVVLDPFAGSGTTGCAAVLEGFQFIGIEKEANYADIADARIAYWASHRGEAPEIPKALQPKQVSLEEAF